MQYQDAEAYEVEIGDRVEVHTSDFEPEEAEVTAIGKRENVRIRYANEYVRPRNEWVPIAACTFISREAADV